MSDRTPIPLDPVRIKLNTPFFAEISSWPYTDPFVASSRPADPATVVGRLTGWLNSPRSGPPIVRPARKRASRTVTPRAAFGNAR